MPKYRAYRFINERTVFEYDFEEASDEAARHILEDGDNLDWEPCKHQDCNCDVTDEVLGLDRIHVDESGFRETQETILEEMPLYGEMPYGRPSKIFVEKVARFEFGDSQALNLLIYEAQKLCGIEDREAAT